MKEKTLIRIAGAGWIDQEEYLCVLRNEGLAYGEIMSFDNLARGDIFSYPFKNFSRLDRTSKLVAYAVALALKDAGETYGHDLKKDRGIVGTNVDGSVSSDRDYFSDYIESGRKLSRGNLFLYTLPSSPLSEAAIHFGLQGPLIYVSPGRAALLPAMEAAADMLTLRETSSVLAGIDSENEAVYFYLTVDRGEKDMLCTLPEALSILERAEHPREIVQEFLKRKKGKKIREN